MESNNNYPNINNELLSDTLWSKGRIVDFKQLQSFLTLAEELHFGRAARRLNIAQPALSLHIKALEQSLGVALFVRDRRSVTLTFEGERLTGDVRAILSGLEQLRSSAQGLRKGYKGRLRIGYVGSSILDPGITMLINGYRKKNPQVDITIEEHCVNEQLALLLGDRLDIGILRSPVPHYDELYSLNATTRPLVAVLPRSHPAHAQRRISLKTLADESFLIQKDPPGVGLGWSALAACERAGFIPRNIQRTRDVSVAMGLVSMGMGVTLVPETQLSAMLPDIGYCLLDDPLATTTLTLCWQRRAGGTPLLKFVQFARELFS